MTQLEFIMFAWLRSLFSWFGLFQQKANIVILGLDNAGKTTLLHFMQNECVIIHEPTRHPQQGTFRHGDIVFQAHDLGGHTAARRLWKQYFAEVDAVIFIIDVCDDVRWAETKAELVAILADDCTQNMSILILVNKIDLVPFPHLRVDSIRQQINGLTSRHEIQAISGQHVHIEAISITKRINVDEAFKWLSMNIKH